MMKILLVTLLFISVNAYAIEEINDTELSESSIEFKNYGLERIQLIDDDKKFADFKLTDELLKKYNQKSMLSSIKIPEIDKTIPEEKPVMPIDQFLDMFFKNGIIDFDAMTEYQNNIQQ